MEFVHPEILCSCCPSTEQPLSRIWNMETSSHNTWLIVSQKKKWTIQVPRIICGVPLSKRAHTLVHNRLIWAALKAQHSDPTYVCPLGLYSHSLKNKNQTISGFWVILVIPLAIFFLKFWKWFTYICIFNSLRWSINLDGIYSKWEKIPKILYWKKKSM